VYRVIIIFFASLLLGVSYNMFLIPHSILSGGVNGLSMIIGLLTNINVGTIIFIINIPILIAGYFKLGRRFMLHTIFSVFVISISMQYIPVHSLVQKDILAAVFGGVLNGIAMGIIFRNSGSTGGFDIIGMLLTRKRDFPLGEVIFAMNAIVVLISGFLFDFDLALYTLAAIYASSKVIDSIHTRHYKLTLMIVTSHGEEMKQKLMEVTSRGITMVDGEGAYTGEKRKVLFTVITRFELSGIKPHILDVDPQAFVNITETLEVVGSFKRKIT